MAAIVGASAVAASAAGIAAFLMKYPRHSSVTGGRYPVGNCFTRWSGCPACQIFYPAAASASSSPPSGMFFRPQLIENLANNYLKGWISPRMLMFLASNGLHHQDAPVESDHGKFPVIIFSHGLFGTLDMYKTICGGLAASGYIVIALEHEDGSAMYSVDESGNRVTYKGPPKGFQYARDTVPEFRKPYLAKRVDEMKKTIQAMGDKAAGLQNCALVESILEQADAQELFLAGHSFGSAACISALQEMTGVKGCLLLDTWMMPVPRAIEEKGLHACPTMFINSEVFAKGLEMSLTRRIAANSTAAIGPVWIAGSVHQSFSDTPCVLPGFLGNKIGLVGTSGQDREHQAMLDSSRAFFQHCRESKDVAELQSLEDVVLADPLISKHFGEPAKLTSTL